MNDEVLQKFDQTLIVRIIRNMEAFFLHDILGCLKELSDDYGIEPIFTHTVSIKRVQLKKFENKSGFSLQQNLLL